MPTLTISDFSCIKHAALTIAPVTVIIGPQGSGKSVTTKLTYFFADILSNFMAAAERGDSIDVYKVHLAKMFGLWFPSTAWGRKRFSITYSAGDFNVRIMRRISGGNPSDTVAVTFSDWFSNFYGFASAMFAREKTVPDDDLDNLQGVSGAFDESLRLRSFVSDRILRDLESEYFAQQTFIPAGRAFFTSIGRLVAGFEQAGSLDPVTVKFAKLFASIKDRHSIRTRARPFDEYGVRRLQVMSDLFGGEIRFEDDAEYVQTTDGRRIPFSFLSSGQQELLPMWSYIDYFSGLDARRLTSSSAGTRRRRTELIYIEEPEAHLFPSAQSQWMEFLISSLRAGRAHRERHLILTTHSPYIMSTLNVFSKAGQLSRRKKRNSDINEIVPRECWLPEGQLAAYAIENGITRSLLDDEGLIDSEYLDSISDELSRKFSALLAIEVEVSSL